MPPALLPSRAANRLMRGALNSQQKKKQKNKKSIVVSQRRAAPAGAPSVPPRRHMREVLSSTL